MARVVTGGIQGSPINFNRALLKNLLYNKLTELNKL